jgi:hypothetical protein
MSGGFFDYQQHKIFEIAESVQSVIDKNYVLLTDIELAENFITKESIEYCPDCAYHYAYPPEVIEKFKEGVELLRKAYVYAHRIDWLLSGDDGEESFLKRLNEELNKIKD